MSQAVDALICEMYYNPEIEKIVIYGKGSSIGNAAALMISRDDLGAWFLALSRCWSDEVECYSAPGHIGQLTPEDCG